MQQTLDICEPTTNSIAIGIDFGTTNSLAAVVQDNNVYTIPMLAQDCLLASCVTYQEGFKPLVGQRAAQGITINSVKRILAKSFAEVKANKVLSSYFADVLSNQQEKVQLLVHDQLLNPVIVASEIFSYIKKQAESYLGAKVAQAVITTPAYFDDNAKTAIRQAAQLAGIEVLRLIAEPTAAAYAYGLDQQSQGNYLVYDLGGGTFDISLLKINQGVFQVLAVSGNNTLGGDDLDHLLESYLAQQLPPTVLTSSIKSELLAKVKIAKEELLSTNQVTITLTAPQLNLTLTQQELVQVIKPTIMQTIKLTEEVLALHPQRKLEGIILVGGSSKLALVREILAERFKVPLLLELNPEAVVALGAAWQAHNLTVRSGNDLLLDVVPLSLGIEVMGGLVEQIISRNTPLPASYSQVFTTHADKQTAMQLHIVQGERELAQDCRSLAYFELTGIPPLPAGQAKVEVTFSLDADGLLTVKACELKSNIVQEIVVRPSYGLSAAQMQDMLLQAMANATDDHHQRLLIEAKLEEQRLRSYHLTVLKNYSLPLALVAEINSTLASLAKAVEADDYKEIKAGCTYLNQLTKEFLAQLAQDKLRSQLQGRNINDLGKE